MQAVRFRKETLKKMVCCTIKGCGARTGRDKCSFFSVPSVITRECDKTLLYSRSRRAVWLERINQSRRIHNLNDLGESDLKPHTKVCSRHFESGQPSKLLDAKSVDWAPSCNLGYHVEDPVEEQEIKIGELSGRVIVEKKRAVNENDEPRKVIKSDMSTDVSWGMWPEQHEPECQVKLEIFDEDFVQWEETPQCSSSVKTEVSFVTVGVQTEGGSSSAVVETQTDLTGGDFVERNEFDCVTRDNVALRAELQNLKQFVMTESQLSENDALVKFYTGLPTFSMLKHVYGIVSANVQHSHRNALSQFQEFLIILMRLRLNLLEQDLAFRFGVSQTTVSKICDKWLRQMFTRLQDLIQWPQKDSYKHSPTVFQTAFGTKVVVLVTCFEVVCYKHKQNKKVRFLIGLTPLGRICFVSKSCIGPGGTDVTLVENSGILDKLCPGDVLIADRNVDIAGCKGLYQPNSKVSIFTKGKTQLADEDILVSTTVNVRTHAERVSSLVKQRFRILQNSISLDLVTIRPTEKEATIDYIVGVCCALTYLCPTLTLGVNCKLTDD